MALATTFLQFLPASLQFGTPAILSAATAAAQLQPPPRFTLEEATIAQIEGALRDGSLTCHSLVQQYLRRIDAYDKNGAGSNAIVRLNAAALQTADDLDRRFAQVGAGGAAALRPDHREGQLRDGRTWRPPPDPCR